jgi:hypothetical protein
MNEIPSGQKLYLPIFGRSVKDDRWNEGIHEMFQRWKPNTKIYGIREKAIADLDPNEWTNVFDCIEKDVKTFVLSLTHEEIELYKLNEEYNWIFNFITTGDFVEINRLYKEKRDIEKKIDSHSRLVGLGKSLFPKEVETLDGTSTCNLNTLVKNLFKKFPMLKHIKELDISGESDILTYVNQIEKGV